MTDIVTDTAAKTFSREAGDTQTNRKIATPSTSPNKRLHNSHTGLKTGHVFTEAIKTATPTHYKLFMKVVCCSCAAEIK